MLKYLLPLLLLVSFAAFADETALREHLQKTYPQIGQIDQVNKSPMPGIYEVVTPDHLFYTDKKGDYLINGVIWDLRSMRNITEERSRKLFAVDYKKLPFELTFKEVKGNGKRELLIFTDPNCGYCKKLERELQKVDNVTIYRLMFPIFEGSDVKVRNVWCSNDRTKTWTDMLLNGVVAPAATDPKCSYPVNKALEWGQKMRINGTPAMIFSDGTLVPGALPAEEIEKALSDSSRQQ